MVIVIEMIAIKNKKRKPTSTYLQVPARNPDTVPEVSEEDEYLEVKDPNTVKYDKIIIKKSNKNQVVLTNVLASWPLGRLEEELKAKDADFAGPDPVQLVLNGRVMDDKNKQLHAYGFKNYAIVGTIFKVIGGTTYSNEEVEAKTLSEPSRFYPKDVACWPKKIQPSKENCSILTGNKCPEDQYNAKIPCCGSVVSAEGAFGLLQSELFFYNRDELKCFKRSCKKVIKYTSYSWLAQLTPEEDRKFSSRFDENALITPDPELKSCPNEECGAYVRRPSNMQDTRIQCAQCRAYEWCWICRGKWKGIGSTKCGNDECQPRAFYSDLLKKSPTATISGIHNVPTLRLCPGCDSTLVEWTKKCKHVKCKMCSHEFCVCCLKTWTDNHLLESSPELCPIYQY